MCVREERVVGNNNCVPFLNRSLEIPEGPLRPHFVKATVKVHQYPHGQLAIFHGRLCLGRYDGDGVLVGDLSASSTTAASSHRQAGAVLGAVARQQVPPPVGPWPADFVCPSP